MPEIPYVKARVFPPVDNRAYVQATSAEWLGLEFNMSPEAIYEWAELFAINLHDNISLFLRRRKILADCVERRTRAPYNTAREFDMEHYRPRDRQKGGKIDNTELS